MDEKIIKTRIVHKHDTEANWNEVADFIPKLGEIIVYDVDGEHSYERIKIGDGITLVSNLPFSIEHIENAIATHKHNYYGVCTTAAGTAAKTVEIEGFELEVGAIVAVRFNNDMPANATMNINSNGAKSIYYRGVAIADNIIKAGDIAVFIYSNQYHLISIDRWQEDIENGTNISSLEEYFVLKTNNITDEYIDALCEEGY